MTHCITSKLGQANKLLLGEELLCQFCINNCAHHQPQQNKSVFLNVSLLTPGIATYIHAYIYKQNTYYFYWDQPVIFC